MEPYVILFTGGREVFNRVPRVQEEIQQLIWERVPVDRKIIIRHGDCPGKISADQVIRRWVEKYRAEHCNPRLTAVWDIDQDPMPADWDNCGPNCPPLPDHRKIKSSTDIFHPGKRGSFCPGAGPRRNAKMVEKGADVCLALPLGPSRGTKGCARMAKRAGIEVIYHPLD